MCGLVVDKDVLSVIAWHARSYFTIVELALINNSIYNSNGGIYEPNFYIDIV